MCAHDQDREPTDRSGSSSDAQDDPEQAAFFDVLGDETRVAIVRALANVRRDAWQWSGLTFAELRRAVGVRDTGNFSYHLDKLRGSLVVKDGDEYKLLNQGMRLAGAMEAGSYTTRGQSKQGTLEYTCPAPNCPNDLEAHYEQQHFWIGCPDHGRFHSTSFPPAVVEHNSPRELAAIARVDSMRRIRLARKGVCPHCWGPMEATLPAPEQRLAWHDDEIPEDTVYAEFDCEQCGMCLPVSPGACVVDHPAVVSLYEDHDLDVRSIPFAALPFVHMSRPVVESESPVRVRLPVERDGDRLDLWLDGDVTVVDHDRYQEDRSTNESGGAG